MPKSKIEKQEILRNLEEKLKRSKSVLFAKYNGLPVKENEELRNSLKNEDSEYYVAKKTLINLAFKDLKIDEMDAKKMEGQLAVIFGYGDEVAPARIIHQSRTSRLSHSARMLPVATR